VLTFNREQGLNVLFQTHEEDIAAFANRRIDFRDGKIQRQTDTRKAG